MPSYKVLHVIDRLDDYGAGRTLQTLVREGGSDCRMQIAAFSDSPKDAMEAWPAVDCRVLAGRWSWDVVALGRLARLLNRPQFDVVHAWDAPSLRRVQVLLRRRVPIAATLSRVREVHPRGLDRIAQIFVGSGRLQEDLTARGVAADQVCLLPPAASVPPPATLSREDALHSADLPGDSVLLALSGPLVRSSRFDDAIWRYELVRVLYPTARLVAVGRGPERNRLERFARLVSDPGRVRILPAGRLADALLGHADVFWQTDCESTPRLEMIDALHRGTPIIAADTAVHREILDHQRTGLLADADDRADFARMTDRVLSDAETGRRLGAAAQAEARKHYAAAGMVARYCHVYETLAGLTPKYRPLPSEPAACTTRH